MEKLNVVCSSCDGSGLYRGMCEQEGYPVVCIDCNGTGCKTISYTPFEKIRKISGVKGVRLSKGTFIATGVGGAGEMVSYDEFLVGKLKYR